jgi:hypothetical protein
MQRYLLSIRAFCIGVGAVALIALAGCGGSSQGSSGDQVSVEASSLSKAEFIEESDKICKELQRQYRQEFEAKAQDVSEELSKAPQGAQEKLATEAQATLVDDILAPSYERLVDQIGSLGAPSGDEEQVTAILRSIQLTIDELRAEPTKIADNLTPFEKASRLATAYGLDGCAASLG